MRPPPPLPEEEEEEEEGGLSLEGERQREEGRLFIKAVNPMQMEKRRRWVRIEKLRGVGWEDGQCEESGGRKEGVWAAGKF